MQRIGFVVFPGFQTMGLAAASVFEFANLALPAPIYDIRMLSETGGSIRTSIGFDVHTEPFGRAVFDTLIVCGGTNLPPPMPAVEAFLRRSLKKSRRTAAICTGAFVLGAAGALEGRRATTHWLFARELQTRFPNAKVEEDRIFVTDDAVWTSAGMSAGVDLALAMIEQDLGIELARVVAKQLVVYHRRSGGQSQFSALLDLAPKTDRIQKALAYAKQNLKSELSVDELAAAASLSPRQFSRAFRMETGQSPAKAVEHLRLEAARLMMEQTRHPIDVIADETGFADRERMRRAFVRTYGQPPQAIRRAF
jgi:transcriptional regulator GlxA family with amidase domain